jgi:hypothetical protein
VVTRTRLIVTLYVLCLLCYNVLGNLLKMYCNISIQGISSDVCFVLWWYLTAKNAFLLFIQTCKPGPLFKYVLCAWMLTTVICSEEDVSSTAAVIPRLCSGRGLLPVKVLMTAFLFPFRKEKSITND